MTLVSEEQYGAALPLLAGDAERIAQRLRLIVTKEALKNGHEQPPRREQYDFRHASHQSGPMNVKIRSETSG